MDRSASGTREDEAATQVEKINPDRMQAGGWRAEGAGEGEGLHVRETLLIVSDVTGMKWALVIRCFADFWVTTVEPWED